MGRREGGWLGRHTWLLKYSHWLLELLRYPPLPPTCPHPPTWPRPLPHLPPLLPTSHFFPRRKHYSSLLIMFPSWPLTNCSGYSKSFWRPPSTASECFKCNLATSGCILATKYAELSASVTTSVKATFVWGGGRGGWLGSHTWLLKYMVARIHLPCVLSN